MQKAQERRAEREGKRTRATAFFNEQLERLDEIYRGVCLWHDAVGHVSMLMLPVFSGELSRAKFVDAEIEILQKLPVGQFDRIDFLVNAFFPEISPHWKHVLDASVRLGAFSPRNTDKQLGTKEKSEKLSELLVDIDHRVKALKAAISKIVAKQIVNLT